MKYSHVQASHSTLLPPQTLPSALGVPQRPSSLTTSHRPLVASRVKLEPEDDLDDLDDDDMDELEEKNNTFQALTLSGEY